MALRVVNVKVLRVQTSLGAEVVPVAHIQRISFEGDLACITLIGSESSPICFHGSPKQLERILYSSTDSAAEEVEALDRDDSVVGAVHIGVFTIKTDTTYEVIQVKDMSNYKMSYIDKKPYVMISFHDPTRPAVGVPMKLAKFEQFFTHRPDEPIDGESLGSEDSEDDEDEDEDEDDEEYEEDEEFVAPSKRTKRHRKE